MSRCFSFEELPKKLLYKNFGMRIREKRVKVTTSLAPTLAASRAERLLAVPPATAWSNRPTTALCHIEWRQLLLLVTYATSPRHNPAIYI
jgi:hypothetical protein